MIIVIEEGKKLDTYYQCVEKGFNIKQFGNYLILYK